MKDLRYYFALVPFLIPLALLGVRAVSACGPSINCQAPNPNPPSTARLNLFPGHPGFSVMDNHPVLDLDPACGVLRVLNRPIPNASGATFSGTIEFTQPLGMQPGELKVTKAIIDNPTANLAVAPPLLQLACGEFWWVTPLLPNYMGFLRTEIDGELRTQDGTKTEGSEELEFTAVGLSMTILDPPQIPQHPGKVMAGWSAGGSVVSPVVMKDSEQKEGRFTAGVGILGLHMHFRLPPGETMDLLSSVKVTFGAKAPVEPPGSGWGLVFLGLGLVVAGAIYVLLRRRGRPIRGAPA